MIGGTASEVEIAFAFGGLLALGGNLHLARDARSDLALLKSESRNGLLLMAARGNVRREATRVLLQVLLLAAVAVQMTADGPPEPYASSGARQLTVFVLLAFQWGLVVAAAAERRTRKAMIAYDDRRDRRSGDPPVDANRPRRYAIGVEEDRAPDLPVTEDPPEDADESDAADAVAELPEVDAGEPEDLDTVEEV